MTDPNKPRLRDPMPVPTRFGIEGPYELPDRIWRYAKPVSIVLVLSLIAYALLRITGVI